MTHLAINDEWQIVAAFVDSGNCAEFCKLYGHLHLPFNSDMHECPAVGSFYLV